MLKDVSANEKLEVIADIKGKKTSRRSRHHHSASHVWKYVKMSDLLHINNESSMSVSAWKIPFYLHFTVHQWPHLAPQKM